MHYMACETDLYTVEQSETFDEWAVPENTRIPLSLGLYNSLKHPNTEREAGDEAYFHNRLAIQHWLEMPQIS